MRYDAPDESPLNPGEPELRPETPPLDEVIRQGVLSEAMRLRVAMPAAVVAVGGDQQVDLQPLFKSRYVDGEVVTLPILKDVPVSMPMGGSWGLRYPLAKGDLGVALFADRALDAWLSGDGAPADPQDTRLHDINDAIFLPGLVPTGKQSKGKSGVLTLSSGKAVAGLNAAGKFSFANGTTELLDLVDRILSLATSISNTLATTTVLVMGAPTPLSSVSSFVDLAADGKKLQAELRTLKE